MGSSPLSAGDGRTWPDQVFTTDSSVFLLGSVNASAIAMHFEDINNNNALYISTGTWQIMNVGALGPPIVPATANFTPSPADVLPANPLGKPGMYLVYPVVTLASGPVAMDGELLQVVSNP